MLKKIKWLKKITKMGKKRRFIANVTRIMHGTFVVWAESVSAARREVEDGILEEYCPPICVEEKIKIDPDFSDGQEKEK